MARQTNKPLLELRGLTKYFGGLLAIDNVSLDILPQEVVCIIGPNGAGKTTLINLVTGVFPPSKGTIWFQGKRIDQLPAYRTNSLGIARTFQDLRLFTNLSVLDNVMVGARETAHTSLIETMTQLGRSKQQAHEIFERSMETLVMVGLEKKADLFPFNLTAQEQKFLGLARCLVTKPTLLFLDEPAGGLSREEIKELSTFVLTLRDKGMTIAFIEHRMEMIMGISERVVVINFGAKIADDTPANIQKNEAVIEAYLPKVRNALR